MRVLILLFACLSLAGVASCSGKKHHTLKGHVFHVNDVAFSPDGTVLASASLSQLKLWDVASTMESPTLTIKAGAPIAFAPDGKTIAASGFDDNLVFLDTKTGKQRKQIPQKKTLNDLVFSPDGRLLVVSEASLTLWDIDKGQVQTTFKHDKPTSTVCATFSPDGRLVASGSRKSVRIWETASGKQVALLRGFSDALFRVVFSPDGKALTTASGSGEITSWDVEKGNMNKRGATGSRGLMDIAFSKDGKWLASLEDGDTQKVDGPNGIVKIWDAVTLKKKATLRGHTHEIRCAAFSPDGKLLATGAGRPDAPGELFLWNMESLIHAK